MIEIHHPFRNKKTLTIFEGIGLMNCEGLILANL